MAIANGGQLTTPHREMQILDAFGIDGSHLLSRTMMQLLRSEPQARPSAHEILQDPEWSFVDADQTIVAFMDQITLHLSQRVAPHPSAPVPPAAPSKKSSDRPASPPITVAHNASYDDDGDYGDDEAVDSHDDDDDGGDYGDDEAVDYNDDDDDDGDYGDNEAFERDDDDDADGDFDVPDHGSDSVIHLSRPSPSIFDGSAPISSSLMREGEPRDKLPRVGPAHAPSTPAKKSPHAPKSSGTKAAYQPFAHDDAQRGDSSKQEEKRPFGKQPAALQHPVSQNMPMDHTRLYAMLCKSKRHKKSHGKAPNKKECDALMLRLLQENSEHVVEQKIAEENDPKNGRYTDKFNVTVLSCWRILKNK
eukprot:TRINITY_DN1227_c0_g2_i1.p1 TRINITY_DN1227_c0_g2~~TRINITY_DN1227_c0_g2_i1.p1  ORF type:complete len:362 (+),score=77.47 TRINITY_DN1227_c0_g2_i1:1360-2445(+)